MSVFSILCRRISVLCVIAAVKHILCNTILPVMHALLKLSDILYFYNYIEIYGFSISCMFLIHGRVIIFKVIDC
jgi:hypothetical protein